MDTLSIAIGVTCVLSSLVVIGCAVPLLLGRVKPNGFYGVRIPQAFESDEAWYRINRYGARQLVAWTVPILLAGITVFFFPLGEYPIVAIVFGIAPLLLIAGAVIQTIRYAQRNPDRA